MGGSAPFAAGRRYCTTLRAPVSQKLRTGGESEDAYQLAAGADRRRSARMPGCSAADPLCTRGSTLDDVAYRRDVSGRRSVISRDPEILSGTPVFVGTRVPVQALLDYLEGGHSLAEFLDDFPTVTQEQATALLEEAKQLLLDGAGPP